METEEKEPIGSMRLVILPTNGHKHRILFSKHEARMILASREKFLTFNGRSTVLVDGHFHNFSVSLTRTGIEISFRDSFPDTLLGRSLLYNHIPHRHDDVFVSYEDFRKVFPGV